MTFIPNILLQLISYIGVAVIILATFKRSFPDIAVIAAFGIFCIPTAINTLSTLISMFRLGTSSFGALISILCDIACVGIVAIYGLICMTSFLPDIASIIRRFWFAPAVVCIIIAVFKQFITPDIMTPVTAKSWAVLLKDTLLYLIIGFLSANRHKLSK